VTWTRLLTVLAAAALAWWLAPKYDTIPRPVVPVPTLPPAVRESPHTQEPSPCTITPATA
jgi:hypothetical protein